MKKMRVLIAGAGHGGLIAAGRLALFGHDVTVLEKKPKDQLGHDWEDRFSFPLLSELVGKTLADFPAGSYRVRGDCAFVSPLGGKTIEVRYPADRAQFVMWRKPLLQMLLQYAEACGAKLQYGTAVRKPILDKRRVIGIQTSDGECRPADLVVDAAGAFSPLRRNLPADLGIERDCRRGDVFYAYRAYYNRTSNAQSDLPFEVYLCRKGEAGLSWYCENPDSADILIGRIDPLCEQKIREETDAFRALHPDCGQQILHGGCRGRIPVRRPLTKMIADGYAAVGDSAFMTTPMNGMGIDLSLQAGNLLADTVENCRAPVNAETLWQYNRMFHVLYGADTAKNECLKNTLLSLPGSAVEFLFTSGVIQSADLDGAGQNTDLAALLQKAFAGLQKPGWFGAVLAGVLRGAQVRALYKAAPESYDPEAIRVWSRKIEQLDIRL